MKIAVYAICKNEEKFVRRWMQSMREADEIYVADTGSTDNTVALLQEEGAVVRTISVVPWRFDTARNLSLELVPKDTDICVCTDLDEVFEPGWRAALEKAWQKDTTRARYHYTWSFHANGTPDIRFYQEKIHARSGFRWIHPVHEVLQYTGTAPDRYVTIEAIQLNHYPDAAKSRGQYLPLLELSVQEAPEDDRNRHYLGREYLFYGRGDDCIRTLKHHLSMPSATWLDERAASMRYIARAYKAKGDLVQAKSWLYRAIAEAPYLREGYGEAAFLAYETGDWLGAYDMVMQALSVAETQDTYISEGFCRDGTLYDIGAVAAYHLTLYREALALCQKALAFHPNEERLQANLHLIQAQLAPSA